MKGLWLIVGLEDGVPEEGGGCWGQLLLPPDHGAIGKFRCEAGKSAEIVIPHFIIILIIEERTGILAACLIGSVVL